MGLLNIIRRMALRQKLLIREIARRTGLSRNTIKKYLNAGTTEPQFATPERQSKLDPFSEMLAGWLKTECTKSRKQRRTLKQMHADLVVLGFEGSYNRVAAFARDWRADRQREQQTTGRGTFVPLSFRPGEAFQFDWSEDYAVLGGERTKLQVAHIKLSHSRAFLVRAYLLQTQEMLFDAHWHGFRVFGGIPERGIYDNMRTAVDRVGRGKERQVNIRFLAMANHYVFEPEFCNPAAGWEKGQVEKNVQDARHRLWQLMPSFPDLAALNDWLEQRCVALWHEIPHAALPGNVADVWAAEQAALMPLPPAFDGFVELSKRVSPTCLISFERNRDSVSASFANRPVSLRVYPDRLVVAAEGQILCEHARVTEDYRDMIYADTASEIETRRKAFLRKWRLKCKAVADSLEEAGAQLFAFTRLDPSQWKSARTTNAIERLNEEFRRRIKTQTVLPCAETVPMLLWALLASGQIQMRKVDGWQTLSRPLEPMPLDLAA